MTDSSKVTNSEGEKHNQVLCVQKINNAEKSTIQKYCKGKIDTAANKLSLRGHYDWQQYTINLIDNIQDSGRYICFSMSAHNNQSRRTKN